MSEKLEELMKRRSKLGKIGALDFLIEHEKKRAGATKTERTEVERDPRSSSVMTSNYPVGFLPAEPIVSYTPFKCKPVEWDGDVEKYRRPPANLPKDFSLPELRGLANDYSHLFENREAEALRSGVSVSIVILTYNRVKPLARTLAGIANQTYPVDQIEVIVTDDGSSRDTLAVVREFEKHLNIRYVWQRDGAFRAAAARNNGVRVARNDFIILLDVDMFPSSTLVENYVRWWPVLDQVALIGPRKYIDINDVDHADILNEKIVESEFEEISTNNEVANKQHGDKSVDWRLEIFYNTENLIKETRSYRVFASGNVAFSRKNFLEAGGFDERFQSWGYEDTELAYRLWNRGTYMVPELDAWAYHQEPEGGKNEVSRTDGKILSGEVFGDLCPHYRHLTSKTENFTAPSVSIYIPAHDAENTICDAIESALNQSYRDLEVCVCDDGSTDRTRMLLERYYSDHPRVRFVTQENSGIGAASNAAVRLCRGMYIGQLDSDDYLATDVVEKCIAELDKSPSIGLVYTTYENEYPDGEIKPGYNYPVFTREKMITAMIAHHFRMFRTKYWYRTSGFNVNIKNAVDYDMYLKLAEVCEARHLNIVGYRRRLHGANTSVVDFKQQVKNAEVVVNKSLNRLGVGHTAVLESDDSPKLQFKRSNE